MSATRRTFVALCAVFALHTCAASAALDVRCTDGVCVANVSEDPSMAPCADVREIILAWRRAGGATLIQCETNDAEMDKPSFIYNRDTPTAPAYAVTGMRWFDAGVLASGGVSDKFASRGFCKSTKPTRMASGDILIGEKVPTGDDNDPYCYSVNRISSTAGGVVVKAADGWLKVRYVGKSGKAIERWIRADDVDARAPAAAMAY